MGFKFYLIAFGVLVGGALANNRWQVPCIFPTPFTLFYNNIFQRVENLFGWTKSLKAVEGFRGLIFFFF